MPVYNCDSCNEYFCEQCDGYPEACQTCLAVLCPNCVVANDGFVYCDSCAPEEDD
jgi:hypothetical protein